MGMQFNACTKHLHPDARIQCVQDAAGALRVQPLRDKPVNSTKQSDAVPSYCDGAGWIQQ